jgi:uncharacterized iron-regulated membrane protein
MHILRRILVLSHRYLGIALSVLAIMWFATGITMMYVGGMPRLTPELRLDRLPALDPSRVTLTPSEAAEKAAGGGRAQLLTVMDRPAYRVAGATVFADTGELLDEATRAQSRTIASRFMDLPEDRIRHVATLTKTDQWTLGQSRALPLHKFRVDDDEATELYVQPLTGEVVTLTTRKSRGFAWISTIPHWLYFSALRDNQPLWYRTVVWTSGAVCVLAVLGLLLGFTQFRKTRPFTLSKAIPYSGWMRWHYITGVVFGVFTLTWAFSGMLSMEPFEWTNAEGIDVPRTALTGGPVELDRFAAMEPSAWNRITQGRAIKEVDFVRIQDAHYYVVRLAPEDTEAKKRERLHQPYYVTGRAEQDRILVAADTLEIRQGPFSAESFVTRLRDAVPDAPVVESALLDEYDSYYYSRRRQTPLPVLRVKFGDPAQTWVYIDPEMGQLLASVPKLARIERWAYNGLHSLDFSFWYYSPAWDAGMIVLLLGCLVSSCLGFAMGVKRLRRGASRLLASGSGLPASGSMRPSATATDAAALRTTPDPR